MKNKCLVAILTYNNGENLKNLIARIPQDYPYDILVHVDGSSDGSDAFLDQYPFAVLRQEKNVGIGRSLRNVFQYARRGGYTAGALVSGLALINNLRCRRAN